MPYLLSAPTLVWVSGNTYKPQVTATYSLSELFAASEAGAYCEPGPTTCYTDNGTTLAGENDLVYRMDDLSGNGNHFIQATEANRPRLRKSGDIWYLEFDGTNDFLSVASLDLSGTEEVSVFCCSRTLSDAAPGTPVNFISKSSLAGFNHQSPWNTSATLSFDAGGNTGAVLRVSRSAAPFTQLITWVMDRGAGTTFATQCPIARLNGAAATGAVYNADLTGNFGSGALFMGAAAGSAEFFNGYVYMLAVRGALTDSDTALEAEAYVAAKSGVTL